MYMFVCVVWLEYVCGVYMHMYVCGVCACMCAPVQCACECECSGKGGTCSWLVKPRTVHSVLNPLFLLYTCNFSKGNLAWQTLVGERGSATPDYIVRMF